METRLEYDRTTGLACVTGLTVNPASFIEAAARFFKYTGRMPEAKATVNPRRHVVDTITGEPAHIVAAYSQFLDPRVHLTLNLLDGFADVRVER